MGQAGFSPILSTASGASMGVPGSVAQSAAGQDGVAPETAPATEAAVASEASEAGAAGTSPVTTAIDAAASVVLSTPATSASTPASATPAAVQLMDPARASTVDADWRRRVFVAQMDVRPGRPDLNADTLIKLMHEAKAGGAKIVIGSELCIAAYLNGDDWEQPGYIDDVEYHQNRVLKEAAKLGLTLVLGILVVDRTQKNEDGRERKYNAGVVVQDGKIIHTVYKTNMPKYHMFDDERHFTPAWKYLRENKIKAEKYYVPVELDLGDGIKRKFGVTLCEDMWSDDYPDNPVLHLAGNGAETIINLSCSPWKVRKNDKRHRVVEARLNEIREAGRRVDFIYTNNVGIQDNGKNIFIFDGASTMYDPDGNKIFALESFFEGVRALVGDAATAIQNAEVSDAKDLVELRDALIYGLRKLMAIIAPKGRVIIGLSGGRDSCLMAYLMVKAIGRERVIGVNLPSEHNRDVTKNIASQTAHNLGIPYGVFPIQEAVDLKVRQLKEFVAIDPVTGEEIRADFSDPNWTELGMQNLQARERGSGVLMLLTHFLRGVTTDNGNKDEGAAGYTTMYGDMVGAFAALADVHKTAINDMVATINTWEGKEIIPPELFTTPPSAELGKDQDVTKGQGDPFFYDYHGPLNRAIIVGRKRPSEILRAYILGDIDRLIGVADGLTRRYFPTLDAFTQDLERIWKLYALSVYKGIQKSPMLTVSRRSRGFDMRESQLKGVYFETAFKLLKEITRVIDDPAILHSLLERANTTRDYESILQYAQAGLIHQLVSQPQEYPIRALVKAEERSWDVQVPGYLPPYYVSPSVLKNFKTAKGKKRWADPEDFSQIDFSRRTSFTGQLKFDDQGRPLNPRGRTGLAGRGLVGKWGPNQAADPIVTRNNPETGELELLVIERTDSGATALPGGMVDEGENPVQAMARELSEEASVKLDFSHATVSHQDYVNDRRNTDHAWIESTAGHVHLSPEQARSIHPKAKSDARRAWWMPVTFENLKTLNANHADMVRIALFAVPHARDRVQKVEGTGKRIAIFGGSFNPPHVGHAAAIRFALDSGQFDEVWCIPAAVHAFDKDIGNFSKRANLVARLIQDVDDPRVKISLVEGENPTRKSYTIDTILALREIYPQNQFSIVYGSDIEDQLKTWDRIDELRLLAGFFKIPRAGYEESALPKISSTELRDGIAHGSDVAASLTPSVLEALQR